MSNLFLQFYNNNNNSIHVNSAFLSALHYQGVSPHPPPVSSIHLDDATAAIVRQNAHLTPDYRWRGDRVIQQIWELLGGHDDQRQMDKFGQDATVTPLLFSKDTLGFLMTSECQDVGLTFHPKDGAFYSIVSLSLYWGVRNQHRLQGEHALLASLAPLPAAT